MLKECWRKKKKERIRVKEMEGGATEAGFDTCQIIDFA